MSQIQKRLSDGVSINRNFFNEKGQLIIPDGTTREEWAKVHEDLTKMKSMSKAWHSDSRKYGRARYGDEFVVEIEAQTEFDLGIKEEKPKPASLNPPGKGTVLVSIEGISQEFSMWRREMGPRISAWDKPELQRALDLLSPIGQQIEEIRNLLDA